MFYRIDTIIQYQNIDFSFCLTESDIKSSEQIIELINEILYLIPY